MTLNETNVQNPRVDQQYKLLAVRRETKLTLRIALNPESKLTLESGTNHTNRNTRACLSIHYRHPQQGEMPVL